MTASLIQQPEGLPVVHGLEDEPAAEGADLQRPFQGGHGRVLVRQLDVERGETHLVQGGAKSV